MMMELWTTHPTKARLAHVSCTAWTHASRRRHPCRTTGTSHVRVMPSILDCFTVVDFGHPPNSSAPQSRILVTVSPTVNGSLNQASLAAETGIQLGQSPTDRVAFCFVNQAVSSILVLAATSSRVNTILSFKLRAQGIHIHGFHVASDSVFHLNAIARILECNPLNTVVILSNNQWCGSWNWAWRGIWVHTTTPTAWDIVLLHLRSVGWVLRGTKRSCWPSNLWYMRFHLCSRAISHALLWVLIWMLLHLVLSRRM